MSPAHPTMAALDSAIGRAAVACGYCSSIAKAWRKWACASMLSALF